MTAGVPAATIKYLLSCLFYTSFSLNPHILSLLTDTLYIIHHLHKFGIDSKVNTLTLNRPEKGLCLLNIFTLNFARVLFVNILSSHIFQFCAASYFLYLAGVVPVSLLKTLQK